MQNIDLNPHRGTDLFALGQNRMQWLQTRQNVLAGNIANADTPGYTAHDVTPFEAALGEFDIVPRATHANHIGIKAGSAEVVSIDSDASIDGNHVTLDAQMEKVAEVNDQQHMATNIYGKYMSMFQTALGK